MKKNDPTKWASVEEARAAIMKGLSAPIGGSGGEMIPIRQALGRILAEDIAAPFNVPGHDNSAMDGYACRFKDLSATAETPLRVVGEAFAGSPYSGTSAGGSLKAKTCIRIMTGGVIPAGADVIVPQEETNPGSEKRKKQIVILPGKRKRGMHIRLKGEDLRAGKTAIAAGTRCRAAHIGLLASLGLVEVQVFRRLRVAFFSTGDEVKTAGQKLAQGDVYDSNRHTIAAMLAGMGCEAIDLGAVPDDPKALSRAMDTAAAVADAVIASGGASVGEADYIRPVLAKRGKVLFWKVAMRPGRPLAYGKAGKADFFGLPGNPVSVMVCFFQFVAPALWKLAGRRDFLPPPLFAAVAGAPLKKSPGRTEYQRGILTKTQSGWQVHPTGNQGSGILSSMTAANCFIVLEAERDSVHTGESVQVQLFEGLE